LAHLMTAADLRQVEEHLAGRAVRVDRG
jgi:hypothetical protein